MIYYISLFILRMINWIYCRSRVVGREHIPARGGYILACNHISNLDPFIIGVTTLRKLNFMAKEELFRNRAASFYWHQVGAFPIKRDEADFRSMREAIRRLKQGKLLVMFPEGTRGSAGRVKKVNPGVGFLVKKAGVPVIPIHLDGTDKVLPNHARWFRFHPVTIAVGEPIQFPPEMPNGEVASAIMEKIGALASRS